MTKAKPTKPDDTSVGYILAPEALWDRAKTSAEEDHRSLTSQVIVLLAEALDARDALRPSRQGTRK